MVGAIANIGQLITSHPKIHGGCPIIAGTGVTVRRIAIWYNQGYNAEEIAQQIEHLSLAQIYAALTYYHLNREEIEADIAAEEAEGDRLEALYRAGKFS
ncbi:MAG: DUF433 domain-containing protein [Spirulina sp.]